jgi:hypothetical protein
MTRRLRSSTRLVAGTAAAFIGAAAMIGWGVTTLAPVAPSVAKENGRVDLWSTGSSNPVVLATLKVPSEEEFTNNR